MKKLIFVLCISFLNIVLIEKSTANEWKVTQEFTNATGNTFASPIRSKSNPSPDDDFQVMGCTSEPIHPYVVVTAAHCIWGIYGNLKYEFGRNKNPIYIQEPGKNANDRSAKRVKVINILHPESIGNSDLFPVGKVESQDDIAFLVLENPIVSSVKHKVASLEQIQYAINNNLSVSVYGYGLNSFAQSSAYFQLPNSQRYNLSEYLFPKKFTYKFATEVLPKSYAHQVGFPKMILMKIPVCGGGGTSGSPAVIEINGEEYLVGPGSHSTGWDCPDNPNYENEKLDPNFKFRNIASHIIIANHSELMSRAINFGESQSRLLLEADLKAKQEAEAKAAEVLKAKQEAEAKAAAELKAKQEAEAKVALELKEKQEAEVKSAIIKRTTITCVKGKLTKKVIAVKPVCPRGYKTKV